MRYIQYNAPKKEKPEDAFLMSKEDTIYVKRTEEYELLTELEKQTKFLQTILVWENFFIKLSDLDSIWNSKLIEKGIHLSTGVKYEHTDSTGTFYNRADSLFFINSLQTDSFQTGASNEITLQGYYNLPVKSVLIYGQTDFMKYGWMGSFLLISFFGTLISIRRLGQVKLSHLITPITEPEVLTIRKAIIYPLNEYLELDVERGLLKTDDGREVELKIIMVQLFEELLISPYYHAFDKDIRLRIWGQEEEPSNVLTQLISRTREAIKPIKELEIRNIRKRGYQLIIHPKGQSWDLLPEDPSPIVMNGILEEE